MSRHIAVQVAPRRHWPIFSPPDLPDGCAECLVCRDWITAVDFLTDVCALPTAIPPEAEGCPVVVPMLAARYPEVGRLTDGSPVEAAPLFAKHSDQLNALRSVDEVDAERERTLGMIQRCAEHQC